MKFCVAHLLEQFLVGTLLASILWIMEIFQVIGELSPTILTRWSTMVGTGISQPVNIIWPMNESVSQSVQTHLSSTICCQWIRS